MLWENKDFMRLWLGQTVSQFGNQITLLALPTVAILVLHVTVFQVGLLGAIEFLPYPILGLFVGVWVDRFARRPILIAANLGRLVTLATVPIAYLYGSLTLYQIFTVAGMNGILTVFYDVAYQSYLPSLVEADQLVEGNSKLQISASAAAVVGPSLAGALIGLTGAAISVVGDAFGYLVSAWATSSIKKAEPSTGSISDSNRGNRLFLQMKEGLVLIARVPVLGTITGCAAMANFGNVVAQSVYLFFAYNELHLTPVLVGLVGTASGVGLLLGSVMAPRISKRLGIGRTLTLSILSGFGWLGYPLALLFPAVPTLMLFAFISSTGAIIFNIVALSVTQRVTPNRLLGRMNATRKTVSRGVIPIGSLLGGILGEAAGLPATIVIGGLVAGASVLWIILGPVQRLNNEDQVDALARSIPSSVRLKPLRENTRETTLE